MPAPILSGHGVPAYWVGANGDFYLDQQAGNLYGPKLAGMWPAPVSLVGPAGNEGLQGDPGDPGTDGAPGTDGDPGADGLPGAPGDPGDDGAPGIDGTDGADVLSAYQLAVSLGFSGDLTAWLASLVGPAGADGAPGIDGIDGTPGADGAPGTDGAAGGTGPSGADGKTVRSGSGVPSGALGIDGDFYIDTTASAIYGPKTAGAWGGATSLIGPTGSDGWTYVKVTTEFSTTSATAVDVIRDGASAVLGFTPAANTNYEFEALLYTRTPTTATVGVRPGLAWPTGLTNGVAEIINPTSATASALVFGNINAALLAAVGGLPNTTQSYPARIRGHIRAGASPSGLVRVQCASETAATAVRIEVGSFLKYRTIA